MQPVAIFRPQGYCLSTCTTGHLTHDLPSIEEAVIALFIRQLAPFLRLKVISPLYKMSFQLHPTWPSLTIINRLHHVVDFFPSELTEFLNPGDCFHRSSPGVELLTTLRVSPRPTLANGILIGSFFCFTLRFFLFDPTLFSSKAFAIMGFNSPIAFKFAMASSQFLWFRPSVVSSRVSSLSHLRLSILKSRALLR